jgi:hypothetical protein
MGEMTSMALDVRLERLRGRVEHWRRSRVRRTEMPAELWTEAVALARQGQPYAVAGRLRVNFEALRRRVAEAALEEERAASRAFVEVSGAEILAAAVPEAPGGVVEVTDRDGSRLSLRLPPGTLLDVAGLVAAFRRAGA